MSQIQVQNLTFAYDGSYDTIFNNVSFRIDTDWKLGMIGRNGRGKTTFLKLLTGRYRYQGTISASVEFTYFPFHVADKTQTAIDVAEQAAPGHEFWMLCRELTLLDVSADVLYRPFCTLSNGEQTKVLLAALFLRENNFLLIDEPTNHLDEAGRALVGNYLKGKKGFLLVSHDRAFLDACIDHVLSINKTDIEVQQGNFSTWQQNREYREQFELAENARLKQEVKRLSEASRRTAGWSDKTERSKIGSHAADRGFIGHKAAKMMKRSKATQARREQALADKAKLLKNVETAEDLAIRPLIHHSRVLAAADGLAIRYGNKNVCEGVSFTVEKGERIVLKGKNGAGKSSILKLLAGEDIPHTGTVTTASGLLISYVSQDTSFLQGSLAEFCREQGIDETLCKAILRKLDFSRPQFETNMEDYSGGQKKKVLIAKSLCQQAHLYLWDEPLNFVDVLSRMQIETLLLTYQPTLLFVEHDRAFQQAVATRMVTL